MAPSSTTLSLTRQLAGPRLGRFLNVSPGDEIVVVKRLRLADGVSMAIETLHIPAGVVPGVEPRDLEGSFYELLRTRYGVEIATATQTIEPTVTNEEESAALERAAPFARLPLRAHEPRRERPDTRVRPLDLPRRSLPDRLRADALVTAPTPDLDKSGQVWEIPRVANWYRPIDAPQDVVPSPGHRLSGRPARASTSRGRFGMRYRVLAVVAAAVALSVVAATTAKSSKAAGHTLTVWLQVDAQNGWPDIVAAANHAFENSIRVGR